MSSIVIDGLNEKDILIVQKYLIKYKDIKNGLLLPSDCDVATSADFQSKPLSISLETKYYSAQIVIVSAEEIFSLTATNSIDTGTVEACILVTGANIDVRYSFHIIIDMISHS